MKTRRHVVALGGLLVVLALVFFISSQSRQPEYQGRKLAAWLEDLRNPSTLTRTNATLAIRQIGTNAVPYLLSMLHAKDSRLKVKLMDLVSKQHWVNFHFRYDFERRSDALRGLGALGPDAKAAIPELANLLNDRSEAHIAAYTLHQIGTDAVPILKQALTNSNSRARSEAAGWLGLSNSGGGDVVPGLIAALKDSDFITKSKAAHALTRFPEQATVIVPALLACLDDPDETFRSNVARALGQFGEKAKPAVPRLLKMVESADSNESTIAARVLLGIEPETTMAAFIKNLESTEVTVRRSTARALMTWKSAGGPAVRALVTCLKDPDNKVKQNAAVALREIGQEPDTVVPALMENLKDPDLKVRSITAIALCNFGERAKAAVPAIIKLIQENKADHFMTESIYMALARVDPEAAERLSEK